MANRKHHPSNSQGTHQRSERANPQITQINADTEKACFIWVHTRVPRAKAFSLVPSFFVQ
jgi:hypothetical protein